MSSIILRSVALSDNLVFWLVPAGPSNRSLATVTVMEEKRKV